LYFNRSHASRSNQKQNHDEVHYPGRPRRSGKSRAVRKSVQTVLAFVQGLWPVRQHDEPVCGEWSRAITLTSDKSGSPLRSDRRGELQRKKRQTRTKDWQSPMLEWRIRRSTVRFC